MAQYRVFNGKRYQLAYVRVDKRRADSIKKELKKDGALVRIVRGYTGYDVYVA